MVQLLAADIPRLAAQNYFGGAVDTSGGLPFTKQGKTLAFLEIDLAQNADTLENQFNLAGADGGAVNGGAGTQMLQTIAFRGEIVYISGLVADAGGNAGQGLMVVLEIGEEADNASNYDALDGSPTDTTLIAALQDDIRALGTVDGCDLSAVTVKRHVFDLST